MRRVAIGTATLVACSILLLRTAHPGEAEIAVERPLQSTKGIPEEATADSTTATVLTIPPSPPPVGLPPIKRIIKVSGHLPSLPTMTAAMAATTIKTAADATNFAKSASTATAAATATPRPCLYEGLPLLPLINTSNVEHHSSTPYAGVRRLALPPAPAECAIRIETGLVVIRSEAQKQKRFLAAFPAGGEVFAIGELSRMPLTIFALELAPAEPSPEAGVSPWLTFRHPPTGRFLEVVPPTAGEGAWMVRLIPRRAISRRSALFCVDPTHGVYSNSARGWINLRGDVLLRGHDRPNTPAGKVASSRMTVLRVPTAALAVDAAFWQCASKGMRVPDDSVAATGAAVPSLTPGGGLRVLTYATKATPMLCDSLLVALVHGVPLTLIGFGEAYHGNFQKLTGARDVVATLAPDTLVLFADAYDVLYATGAAGLRAGFNALRVPPSKVLFMGERGCWPDWDMGPLGRKFCTEEYPASATPYRYVNSGVWMGRAAAAHRLLTVLASYTPGLDDQHVTGHLFVDRNEWFALDRDARLFQSMHGNAKDVQFYPPSEVFNRLTNSTPRVLHFNGGAKDEFPRFRDYLLSAASCLPTSSSIATPDGQLSFTQVCPHHRLPAGKKPCSALRA